MVLGYSNLGKYYEPGFWICGEKHCSCHCLERQCAIALQAVNVTVRRELRKKADSAQTVPVDTSRRQGPERGHITCVLT